jgi:hypothetical protein
VAPAPWIARFACDYRRKALFSRAFRITSISVLMSTVGSPIDTSLLQAAQAQQTASKARDREKAASQRQRRAEDFVELRVDGVESAEAVRRLPQNDSEQAGAEHDERRGVGCDVGPKRGEERPRIDVQA